MAAQNTAPPRASFLGLPVELRDEVYRNLLSTKRTKRQFGLGFSRYHLQPAILRVNHQIYSEALRIWRKNKFILITTPWTAFKKDILIPGKFPLTVSKKKASLCRAYHMKIKLDFLADHNPDILYGYVTCLEDLETLCRLLYYKSCQISNFASFLHITLVLQDPHSAQEKRRTSPLPNTLQESLICPFAIIKDLDGLTLQGAYSKCVEEDLRKALARPNPTPAEYLEKAAALKDEGNVAFKDGDYRLCIEIYIKAYEAMHFIIDGKRFVIMLDCYFADTGLVGGRFDGRRGDLIRHQLGSQLSWNILQAYLKLEDFEQAYTWAERAISDIEYANVQQIIHDGSPNLVTDTERAKVYYRMVLACKGLGKPKWDIENNLFKAITYAPDDPTINKEAYGTRKTAERRNFR